MTGFIVLGLVAAYVAFFFVVLRRARNPAAKITAVVIALLIPFWDLPFGYFNFRNLCDVDGGARLIDSIAPQESLLFTSYPGEPEFFLKTGLKAVEYGNQHGGVRRFERSGSTIAGPKLQATGASTLQVRFQHGERLPWSILRQEYVLEERSTGRPIARAKTYSWQGGWISSSFGQAIPWSTCHPQALQELVEWTVRERRA